MLNESSGFQSMQCSLNINKLVNLYIHILRTENMLTVNITFYPIFYIKILITAKLILIWKCKEKQAFKEKT